MCSPRWASARSPGRRSGCRSPGMPPRRMWTRSLRPMPTWPRACVPPWRRPPGEPTSRAMSDPAAPHAPVYLDNQATTRCDPRVLDAMLPWFSEEYGNPHSTDYAMGRHAEAAVEQARAHVAALLGADTREIVFTSGATESNNLAIKGAARYAMRMGNRRR